MKDTRKVFVVSHTHWDREWYFTQPTFQMMNADMMDRLLAVLRTKKDYTAFLLDGQLIALEDYLAVNPARREEIAEYVRRGTLAIGPWYVLPDEYLASGEAHIRNFMEGMRVAEAFGGGTRMGYLPDSFGHPSQIPQIIRGLGMDELIFWRGPGPEVGHAEFCWQGKDGTEILALNMAYGYSNAACLPEDGQARHARLDHEIAKLADISHLNLVLLMNGSDHLAPDANLPRYIAEYQQARPELTIAHATLADYVREAKARAAQVELQEVVGELRSGYRAYLLGDTLSTRMPLKQRQRTAEAMLEKGLEPAFAMLALEGRTAYPTEKLRFAWRCLLQNLPHDSICGCSVDAVHRDMLGRYRQLGEICAYLKDAMKSCLHKGDAPKAADADGEIVLFNPHLGEAEIPVAVTLQKVLHPLRYVDYAQDQKLLEFTGESNVPPPTGVLFMDGTGKTYEGTVTVTHIVDTVESCLETQPTMNRCLEVVASFAPKLPSLGYARLNYRFLYEQPETVGERLENEFFVVHAEEDGGLAVLCKETGRQYHGLGRLFDAADAGDEYTYDPLPGDAGIGIVPGSLSCTYGAHTLAIKADLRLPIALAEDRQARSADTVLCPVMLEASLLPGVPRIDVKVTVDNRAKDHRLVALFPLGEEAKACASDSTFSIENRPLVWDADEDTYKGWMEKPNNSFFQKNFADLAGAGHGLAVFVKGLPQFEVKRAAEGDMLCLTLLRCVGWLSRKDLRSRDGNGGWTVATPEAQELGQHTFDFAIYPHGEVAEHALYRQAIRYAEPLLALQTDRSGGGIPAQTSFVRVAHPAICCSAFKGAEDGEGFILRLHNMSDEVVDTRLDLTLSGDVTLIETTLDERLLPEPIAHSNEGNGVTTALTFQPWQIRTLRIVVK